MSTYTQIIYHIVFSTKNREHAIGKYGRDELYAYMCGILQNKECHVYQIGGISNHVHIITHLHPTISLASLLKDIKVASSAHIKSKSMFVDFNGWQDGYSAFTCSIRDKDRLIDYVQQQEEHHRTIPFIEEYRDLLRQHEIVYDEKYLF